MLELLEKQEHAVWYLRQPEIRQVVYGGAAGGGKSALGCLWLIDNCQNMAGSRWLMGRARLKRLKETTLKTFFELSTKLGINDQWHYNRQDHVIYWHNGSEIILKDLMYYPSDPEFDDLGSLEICGAFVDEVGQLVRKAWEIVLSRCRYKLEEFNITPKVLGTCNPTKGFIYNDYYHAKKKGTIAEKRAFVSALPTDNHHLHESYLETLRSLDKNSRERLYYGNWEYDDDPSILIDYDSIRNYFNPVHIDYPEKDEDDNPIHYNHYLTVDVARKGKDMTVMRVWKEWLCIERVEMKISLVNEVVERSRQLMVKHGIPLSNVVVDEDGVGGGVVDFLGCKGFVNNGAVKEELIGGKWQKPNYRNLKTQCSYKMAEMIRTNKTGEVGASTHVVDLVTQEMGEIKQKDIDKDGKIDLIGKDTIKENIGRSPDDWDSIMMRYFFEIEPKSFFF